MSELRPPDDLGAVVDYYQHWPEETRLEHITSRLEEVRTRELILRHVPGAPAKVLDVGGAAGVYALWLAALGYEVHLVDASPRLVDEARARSDAAAYPLASCTVGDARALEASDASADVVLMLGPLYHLVEAADRHRALAEAARVLATGGVLIAAAISRWASALDGLSRDLLTDPRFERIVARDLQDGQHRNPTERIDYFTTAYFHRPDDLRREVEQADLAVEGLYGIEGPGWMFPDLAERWNDKTRQSIVLQVARLLESEPAMMGTSAHMLIAGRKLRA
jgi:ubiquinone/menaquinone biosynthesis C-methylase UbiE